MSMELIDEMSNGLVEIYDEIGVPMTYLPFDTTVTPNKFGALTPSYDTTKAFSVNGLLNIEEQKDKDTNLVSERDDGEVAIVTKNFVLHNIIPKKKDKIIVVDTYGRTLNLIVTGIVKTPGATNVGIPFLITYFTVAFDSTISRE